LFAGLLRIDVILSDSHRLPFEIEDYLLLENESMILFICLALAVKVFLEISNPL
jgi:hypothetical protein